MKTRKERRVRVPGSLLRPMTGPVTMDKIVALCKRRGLIFPASEIYGGHRQHLRLRALRRSPEEQRDRRLVAGDDPGARRHRRPRLGDHPAPAHLGGVRAPRRVQRPADRVPEPATAASGPTTSRRPATARPSTRTSAAATRPSKLPGDHQDCDLTEAREFNLMFETQIGPVKDAGSTVYLRPETAQGIFLDFKTTLQYARKKPPFGIAQIGKSFRNEITPGNFIFRTLEFEQMEMEFFVPPDEAEQVARALDGAADGVVRVARNRPGVAAAAPARRGRAVALLERHERHRVPVPDRLVRARGNRQPRRLRPHASTPSTRGRSWSTWTRRRRALRAARDRAGRRAWAAPCWRSCATPTTRTTSAASSAPCCGSRRTWRRSRSRCCRS